MNQTKEKYNEKWMNSFIWRYILVSSLDGDLIVMAIIDTLFLSIVKGLSASSIMLYSSVSAAIGILIQPYILKIIHKVGNTVSIRIAAICLLISSTMITFCRLFWLLVIGKIFYEIAFVFKNMEAIMLKNNLIYAKREKEYVKIRNQSNIAYAVITAIISFGAGSLFNINAYLPMVLNIGICFICCILAFGMKDVTKNDKIPEIELEKTKVGKISMIAYICIISYAFFYTAINLGQQNSKLWIQYQLGDYFDAQTTAVYFSAIIAMSRITRIVANLLFDKIYQKLQDKINIALCGCFVCSFFLFVIGNFINTNVFLKFGLISVGFFIILAVRDPFKIYIQDLLLKVAKVEEQQTLFAHLELAKKIGQTLMGFAVSALLLKISMIWVLIAIGVIALMSLKATIRLFVLVLN